MSINNKKKKRVLDLCIEDTNSRQMTLRKYYPIFEMHKLNNNKSSKYKDLDMVSLSLAVLHYMLIEGKLKETGVSFEDLESFLGEYLDKCCNVELDKTDIRELTRYITGKLNNETGEAFLYTYFDPKRKSVVNEKVKYIKYVPSKINSDEYLYYLTNDGIDFFLQTKEFGEESKVTIYLLLLQQQLKNNDFEGVYNSVVKINAEVLQQIEKKKEISEGLLYAGEEGFKKYIEYCEDVSYKLKEEHDLFATTYKMVLEIKDGYIKKANINFSEMKEEEQENIQYLYNTDNELSLTIERHSVLLNEVVKLKKDVLAIRKEKRRKAFKKSFSFENYLNTVVKSNNVFGLRAVLNPLFNPNIKKDINPYKIDAMFNFNQNKTIDDSIKEECMEVIQEQPISIDKVTEERITKNYRVYMKELLMLIKDRKTVSIIDLSEVLKSKYSAESLIHADFTAFIFSMYEVREIGEVTSKLNYMNIVNKGAKARLCEVIYRDLIDTIDEINFLKYTTIDINSKSKEYYELGNGIMITNFEYVR